jgi:hypothetical protein
MQRQPELINTKFETLLIKRASADQDISRQDISKPGLFLMLRMEGSASHWNGGLCPGRDSANGMQKIPARSDQFHPEFMRDLFKHEVFSSSLSRMKGQFQSEGFLMF